MRTALLATLSCLAIACSGSSDPPGRAGTQCDRNGDCAAPLVCDLGSCRNQCNTTRDCVPGTSCIRGAEGFGVCQLVEETRCALDSECPGDLVCRERQCVNDCTADRDCPAGARCVDGACIDRETAEACVRDSECPFPARCALDGRCRVECTTSRECRLGTSCIESQCLSPCPCSAGYVCFAGHCHLPCSATEPCPRGGVCEGGICGAAPDAGTPDAGTTDGGGVDAGTIDGGGDAGGPGPCIGSTPVRRLAAGMAFTCALLDAPRAGQVVCWGRNDSLQLGTTTPVAPGGPRVSTTPVLVEGVTDAVDIRAGEAFACAMLRDLRIMCWGENGSGNLGLERSGLPELAMASTLSNVRVADPGSSHACANVGGTEVRCWGDRSSGKLGDGMTSGTQLVPQVVPGITNPSDVSAGGQNTCVLAVDQLYCWGQDDRGQVGNGGGAFGPPVTTPALLPGRWSQVDISWSHACALDLAGMVWCWGDASFGAAGDGVLTTHQLYAPSLIPGGAPFLEVRTGDLFTCGRNADFAVQCWGWNDYGQLGEGAVGPSRGAPGPAIPLPGPAQQVVVGQQHACALVGTEAWCWGNNELGQLGRSLSTRFGLPERVECIP